MAQESDHALVTLRRENARLLKTLLDQLDTTKELQFLINQLNERVEKLEELIGQAQRSALAKRSTKHTEVTDTVNAKQD